MSPQEKAAIVSGIFTFIGGSITFFLMKYYEQRQLLPVGGARRNALCGNWKGQITQRTVGSYEVEMSLQSKGNKIIGKGWLRHIERNLLITLEMEGGFLYENFLNWIIKTLAVRISSLVRWSSKYLHVRKKSRVNFQAMALFQRQWLAVIFPWKRTHLDVVCSARVRELNLTCVESTLARRN